MTYACEVPTWRLYERSTHPYSTHDIAARLSFALLRGLSFLVVPRSHPQETVRVLDTTPTLADAGCPLWLLPPKYTTVPLLPVGDAAASYHVMQSPGVNEATLMVDDAGRIVTGTEEDVACVRAAPRHRNPAYPGASHTWFLIRPTL